MRGRLDGRDRQQEESHDRESDVAKRGTHAAVTGCRGMSVRKQARDAPCEQQQQQQSSSLAGDLSSGICLNVTCLSQSCPPQASLRFSSAFTCKRSSRVVNEEESE